MEKFARYLAAVDGTNDWATIGPLFDDAIAPDCIFVTDEGEHDKTYWTGVVKGLVEKGAVASDLEVTRQEGDVAYYHLTITIGDDEPLDMAAKGTLRDGRLTRVEPIDPAVYSRMVERSS